MQSIKRALDQQGQMIRVPCYIGEARRAIKQAQSDLTTQLGREPTTREIANAVELTEKKVLEIFNATRDPVPLDAPINEDSPDGSFSELIPDQSQITPENYLLDYAKVEVITEVLNRKLNPRETQVIILRYGLDGRHGVHARRYRRQTPNQQGTRPTDRSRSDWKTQTSRL